MSKHNFIFCPGTWLGLGKLELTGSPTKIRFYMKWSVLPIEENVIYCEQLIELEEGDEPILNRFQITITSPNSFDVKLENMTSGIVYGKGAIDGEVISWEYKEPVFFEDTTGFTGEEVYILQPNGEYMLRSEYKADGEFKTIIEGRIWKKEDL